MSGTTKKTSSVLRPAFSAIELLVVIAILGVALALVIPAAERVRIAAARMENSTNLKTLGDALLAYHDAARTYAGSVSQEMNGVLEKQDFCCAELAPLLREGDRLMLLFQESLRQINQEQRNLRRRRDAESRSDRRLLVQARVAVQQMLNALQRMQMELRRYGFLQQYFCPVDGRLGATPLSGDDEAFQGLMNRPRPEAYAALMHTR